tara:strand:+ start:96 stop:437 length:342 start_codon:yes stop_codon:yes gene_type:complete
MINQINCIGRLGEEPKLAETTHGKPMVSSSIAVNLSKGNPNVEWFNITAFDDHALTLANYCKKDDQVIINGALTVQYWENAHKENKSTWNIKVKEVHLQGKAAIRMNSKKELF